MVDIKKNEHLIEGINSRMDGIQGSVLNVKLKYIDKFNTKRNNIAKLYNKFLKNIGDLKLPQIKKQKSCLSFICCTNKKRDELKKNIFKQQYC